MTARSADESFDALVSSIRSIARCITLRPIITHTERDPERIVRLSFGPANQPVALRSSTSGHRVFLELSEELAIERTSGSSRPRRRAYFYRILDRHEREILAYHWHPHGRSAVTAPHLHLSNQVRPIDLGQTLPLPLADLHIITGQVTLADVVGMLIGEFGIDPLVDDWRTRLARYAG